jgi:hypothetical protein
MPNWAFGSVTATGTKQSVIKFSNHFIYSDEQDAKTDIPFFLRSVSESTHKETTDEIDAAFKGVPEDAEYSFTFYVAFAWSAIKCLVSETPQSHPGYISLIDACKEDSIAAVVEASETSSGVEEMIRCSKDGQCDSQTFTMQTEACVHCGADNHIASGSYASEQECIECGEMIAADNNEEDKTDA